MKARSRRLKLSAAAGGVFLRLLVARVAAGKTRGEVGDDGDRGAAQAGLAREDHLRHGRHADEVGAEDSRGANFGRRLEARSGEPHVDAFVELDVRRARRRVEVGQQRLVIGSGQRHETVRPGMADQRIGPGKVDVIGDRDQRRRRPFLVEAAGGVGEEERLAAEHSERVDRDRASRAGRRARNNGRGPETARPAGLRFRRRPAAPRGPRRSGSESRGRRGRERRSRRAPRRRKRRGPSRAQSRAAAARRGCGL